MDISNNLFQALLKQQGLIDFRRISIQAEGDGKFFYGYFKDERFHVCDEELNEVDSRESFPNDAQTMLLIQDEESYHLRQQYDAYKEGYESPWTTKPNNWVINREGDRLLKDVSYYQPLSSLIQVVKRPTRLMDIPIGTIYEFCKDNLHLADNEKAEGHSTIKCNYRDIKEGKDNVLMKGKLEKRCTYLFAMDDLYFFNKDFSLWVVNKDGNTVFLQACEVVWYSKYGVKVLSKKEESGRSEWTIHSLDREKAHSRSMGRTPNDSDYEMPRAEYLGTPEYLLSHAGDKYVSIIDPSGKILFYKCFYNVRITRFANDLITLRDDNQDKEVLDVYGNSLGYIAPTGPRGYMVFKRELKQPVYFNEKDKTAHPYEYARELYGVLQIMQGEIIIPAIFSKIQIHSGMNETLLSIVSISNSGEGKEQVYQGLYVGRQLIVPIGCEDIKFMEYEERRYEYPHDKIRKKGNYIRYTRNGKQGLVYYNGIDIVNGCDEADMLYHENGCPNCALASQRGKYAFIYRDKLITGFVFDKIEAARITGWHDSDTQWAKVWKDGQCAIYRNEEPIIGYYTDIKAIKTKLFSLSEESSYSNVLFIVTGEDGKKGLYRMDEKEILPCVYESLKISEEVIYADGQYFDGDGSVVFECEGYDFLTKAKGGYGSSLCYANHETLVFVQTGSAKIREYERYNNKQTYTFGSLEFDFKKERFVPIEEEKTDNAPDYQENDNDYERDTYYALGEDDYARWRDQGGNLDDMMDGIGY